MVSNLGLLLTAPFFLFIAALIRLDSLGPIFYRQWRELTTLLNVLKGDMGLVGPHPELLKYLPYYREEQKKVFSVRPGMTDLATLRFRDEAKILVQADDPERVYVEHILPEKLKFNLEYIERQSFRYDLSLIFKTLSLTVHQPKP